VSALEALALDVESRAPPKEGDEPADPGARPDRLLGYGRRSLNLKPKTKVGDDEPASYGPSKIAKGCVEFNHWFGTSRPNFRTR
jgi:hypothetical protein